MNNDNKYFVNINLINSNKIIQLYLENNIRLHEISIMICKFLDINHLGISIKYQLPFKSNYLNINSTLRQIYYLTKNIKIIINAYICKTVENEIKKYSINNGFNIITKCLNRKCVVFDKFNIFNLYLGKFSKEELKELIKCSFCKNNNKNLKMVKQVFKNCQFIVKKMEIGKNGLIYKHKSDWFKCKDENRVFDILKDNWLKENYQFIVKELVF